MTLRLPAFPWDTLAPIAERAREHPDGVVDLSVGTPVDPTPDVVQRALCEASDSPGYPTTAGLPELRDACTQWLARCTGATDVGFLPTIGSKEMVAWLPTGLGIGPSDTVVIPEVAYPTYDVGATVAGARVVAARPPRKGADEGAAGMGGRTRHAGHATPPHLMESAQAVSYTHLTLPTNREV